MGPGGTFLIGDSSQLEFASAVGAVGQTVAAGQTISFADGNCELTLDNPSAFAGYIANLVIGDTIDLIGISVKAATIKRLDPYGYRKRQLSSSDLQPHQRSSVDGRIQYIRKRNSALAGTSRGKSHCYGILRPGF